MGNEFIAVNFQKVWTELANKMLISLSDNVYNFLGNQTHKDHFKLLQIDGGSLLIGARNVIYNLSLDNLRENIEQVRKRKSVSLRNSMAKSNEF